MTDEERQRKMEAAGFKKTTVNGQVLYTKPAILMPPSKRVIREDLSKRILVFLLCFSLFIASLIYILANMYTKTC